MEYSLNLVYDVTDGRNSLEIVHKVIITRV